MEKIDYLRLSDVCRKVSAAMEPEQPENGFGDLNLTSATPPFVFSAGQSREIRYHLSRMWGVAAAELRKVADSLE